MNEHQRDLEKFKPDSHMLKHYFDKHHDEELEMMKFGARMEKQTRSAFNREIGESVVIQSNKDHHLLNSKSEFNRCALPRLTAKLGEVTLASLEKEKKEEKEKEDELRRKIRNLKIKISEKRRWEVGGRDQPANKKRRLDERHKRVVQEEKQAEKRQGEATEEELYEVSKRAKYQRRDRAEFEEYLA